MSIELLCMAQSSLSRNGYLEEDSLSNQSYMIAEQQRKEKRSSIKIKANLSIRDMPCMVLTTRGRQDCRTTLQPLSTKNRSQRQYMTSSTMNDINKDYEHFKSNFAVNSEERFHMCQKAGFLNCLTSLDQMGRLSITDVQVKTVSYKNKKYLMDYS
ncbi:hypothetical protein Q9966_016103 [Columba livia]|nr:hypothetical protein Q9966_016103 [Columba livia]